MKKLTTQVK